MREDGDFYSKLISMSNEGEDDEDGGTDEHYQMDMPRRMTEKELEMLHNIEVSLAKFRDNIYVSEV